MLLSPTALVPSLGLFPSGDLAHLTIYTTKRRRVVAYDRSPPTSPPTALQTRQRRAWAVAAHAWSLLPPETRALWAQLARAAHTKTTGYNLYIHFRTTEDCPCLKTLCNQAGLNSELVD